MATDPILDELNLTTLKEIYPVKIEDNFFADTPFQAYLRDHCLVPFGGGAFMQTTFLYKPMIGGAYAKGDNFNITKRQTLSGLLFDPKYYYVSVPEYLEDIEVENKGKLAVFSLIDTDLTNAMQTISAIIAIDLALHGQGTTAGVVGNRPKNMNGWLEAINDGKTPGWDGSVFANYGTQARNGAVGSTINSIPLWLGDAAGNTGPLTYNALEESYQDCSIGKQEPNIGVTTKAGYAFAKERMQTQQRFTQERDPVWGVTGFRFNNAMVLKDDYFPSAKYGINDPDLGNYKTGTFDTTGMTPDAKAGLPANTVCTVGEVFAWLNTAKWLFRVANSKLFGFGFSGFVPAQDNTRVVGQIKAMCNLECIGPRYNKQLYGIGS